MNAETDRKMACLREKGLYLSTPTGRSMRPLFKGKNETVVISPVGTPKRGDVLLYESTRGKQILHRVIRVTPEGYLMRGDNCPGTEPLLTPDRVIGRMTAFWRGERYTDCETSRLYRLYARLWPATYPLRAPFLWMRTRLAALLRRCKKR